MDILITANYCRDFLQSDNNRFVYLSCMLAKEHDVEIVTSDFHHSLKKHRDWETAKWPFKITLLHEPGYKKNVSLKRMLSHKKLAKNLTEYLKKRKKPDVIYCSVPSLDFAEASLKYAKKNGVRFILDIQDLWPEAFKMVLKVPVLSDILFSPMERKANRIYSQADCIAAVSKTYVDRALKCGTNAPSAAVFLGTEMAKFDSFKQSKLQDGKIRIVYIGTLGRSYDLTTVITAISKLKDKDRVELVVMGDGYLQEQFKESASRLSVNSVFYRRLPYDEMVTKLCGCDIAVNPIKKGSAGSVINKVGDYAMAGLPVVNTQECAEYRQLLDEYGAGINCRCEDVEDVSNALQLLIEDADLREKYARGSRRLGEEKFDRAHTYRALERLMISQ